MRTWKVLMAGLGLLSAAPSPALAKVHVFACAPEWGALAEEIGGVHVEVFVATTARQDVHHVRAKPSLLAAMRKADLVVCSGAALESGWLPILLKKAGGPDVQPATAGYLMASDFVPLIGVMKEADRSMGHIHPEGNPHVHLNPNNLLLVAQVLAERLLILDPDNLEDYSGSFKRFETGWMALVSSWKEAAAGMEGAKVVVYHDAWAYLLDWLGMEKIASLEPKPGLPPTASHLEAVLQAVDGRDVRAILVAPYEDGKAADWLSGRTGIPVLRLPYTVGGSEDANDIESLFAETMEMLKGVR